MLTKLPVTCRRLAGTARTAVHPFDRHVTSTASAEDDKHHHQQQQQQQQTTPSSLSPLLPTWYSLTRHIPLPEILPIGLGNTHDAPNHNAFFGDKRLNLQIALLLRKEELPPLGAVTKIQSTAMSNELLAACLPQILPYHTGTTGTSTAPYGTTDLLPSLILANSQIHDAGTMVEAAVDYVANMPIYTPTSQSTDATDATDATNTNHNSERPVGAVTVTPEIIDTALNELALFLIEKAQTCDETEDEGNNYNHHNHKLTFATTDLHNPKADFINYGGTITCRRLDQYPDHAPQFTATAQMDDLTATVHHGRNKRDTEQAAAALLWRYYLSSVLPEKRQQQQQQSKRNASASMEDNDDMENPKGRILSIGGNVTSEQLSGYPDHLPCFRAVCNKPFFSLKPSQQHSDDDDDDEEEEEEEEEQLEYMIEATAKGRTRYEAERIAALIVWQHVMNMKTIFTADESGPKETNTIDRTDGWFNDLDENEPMLDPCHDPHSPEPEEPERSAQERRRQRPLNKATVRHISQFEVHDDPNNFVPYELTNPEQPHINLRPGGETVIESWYRGALNPMAAFHRALIAPHVFPNHVGTVNAFVRRNMVPNEDDGDDVDTWVTLKTDQSVATANDNVANDFRQGNAESDTNSVPIEDDESLSDITATPPLVADTVTVSAAATAAATTSFPSSDDSAIVNPPDDSRTDGAERRDKKYTRTFTVLAFVVPNLNHPLLANMTGTDFNTNELLTKCFVEHGYNARETRSVIGVKINQYIIDVLLKNYENLDEILEKEKKQQARKSSDALTKAERKTVFFKF